MIREPERQSALNRVALNGALEYSDGKPVKPNILFIMADDIGWFNLSCYNHGIMGYRTPNMDRIARARCSRRLNSAGVNIVTLARRLNAEQG